jgi:hypothetical protein
LLREQAAGSANDGSTWNAWIGSNRGSIQFNFNTNQWHYVRWPNPFPGNTGFMWFSAKSPEPFAFPTSAWQVKPPPGISINVRGFDWLGFGFGTLHSRSVNGPDWSLRGQTSAKIPHWFIALILIAPPLLILRRLRCLRRRLAAGLCPGCGYDLRASKDRCPECGRVIEPQDLK